MLRIEPDQLRPLPQLKVCEIEARRARTARQRERFGVADAGSEPTAGLDCRLKHRPRVGIAPQLDLRVAAVRFDHIHGDRAAGVKMPELIRLQTMEGAKVVSF